MKLHEMYTRTDKLDLFIEISAYGLLGYGLLSGKYEFSTVGGIILAGTERRRVREHEETTEDLHMIQDALRSRISELETKMEKPDTAI